MEAMRKQVVPVLYEESYQLNFLPVLYGPSTGRIVPDQHQDSFFRIFFAKPLSPELP